MPVTQQIIDFLLARKSAPIDKLHEPGPSDGEIATLIRIASRVPDHGRLVPWRFILYRGDARHEIGGKERTRFSRAPLVVGVVHIPRENPKIPAWEMFLSGGMAAMNLMIAANALGYGTNLITNWYSDSEEGRRILGLRPEERVVGFVHIGSFAGDDFERQRPDPAAVVSDYAGPAD